jgi:hypothetical protein
VVLTVHQRALRGYLREFFPEFIDHPHNSAIIRQAVEAALVTLADTLSNPNWLTEAISEAFRNAILDESKRRDLMRAKRKNPGRPRAQTAGLDAAREFRKSLTRMIRVGRTPNGREAEAYLGFFIEQFAAHLPREQQAALRRRITWGRGKPSHIAAELAHSEFPAFSIRALTRTSR